MEVINKYIYIDGYSALYKGDREPKFCMYCGSGLKEYLILSHYDQFTGSAVFTRWILCSENLDRRNMLAWKHSAWKDMDMTKEEHQEKEW